MHLFGYPADMEALGRCAASAGLGVVEDACEALGAVDSAGMRVGASGNPAAFGFYANKQLVTGEGGMLTCGDGEVAATRPQRAQPGPRPTTWTGSRTTGWASTTGSRTSPRRSASPRSSGSTPCSAERDRVARLYRERLSGIEGLVPALRGPGQERRSWFVFVVQVPEGADRDGVIAALAEEGIASKAYLPCIHLQPLYRERFGFRGGEFPVAERVAARSLALPFFTAMGETEVDRVGALERARPRALSGSTPILSITCQPRRPGRPPLRCRAGAGSACWASWASSPPVRSLRGCSATCWRTWRAASSRTLNWLLTGAIGFALMGVGLLASLPVVLSIGRTPDHRLYPRSRSSLAGWGVSLYLLGAMLVVQIGAIAHNW